MNNNQSIIERLTELEIGQAHQQRLCEQLNEVVTSHTRQVMQLEKVISELTKQLTQIRELRKSDREELRDEKPPHY